MLLCRGLPSSLRRFFPYWTEEQPLDVTLLLNKRSFYGEIDWVIVHPDVGCIDDYELILPLQSNVSKPFPWT